MMTTKKRKLKRKSWKGKTQCKIRERREKSSKLKRRQPGEKLVQKSR
jgi:hypothetical protein